LKRLEKKKAPNRVGTFSVTDCDYGSQDLILECGFYSLDVIISSPAGTSQFKG